MTRSHRWPVSNYPDSMTNHGAEAHVGARSHRNNETGRKLIINVYQAGRANDGGEMIKCHLFVRLYISSLDITRRNALGLAAVSKTEINRHRTANIKVGKATCHQQMQYFVLDENVEWQLWR